MDANSRAALQMGGASIRLGALTYVTLSGLRQARHCGVIDPRPNRAEEPADETSGADARDGQKWLGR